MLRSAILAAAFLLIALFGGIWLGGHPSSLPEPIRDAFVNDSEAQQYQEAVDLIEDDYFRKVEPNKLLDKSLESAVGSLRDDFSAYFDPKSYKEFQETTNGAFEGVGMTVQEVKRGLEIVRVFDRSPAKRAGLRTGDVIVAVDGHRIAGQTSDQATAKIKGKAGTDVSLTWVRKGKRTTRQLQRARVDVPIVDSRIVRGPGGVKVGHVSLVQFSAGAHAQVAEGIRKMRARGAKAIVFDLRANGGGLLNEAVLVSSLFIADGKIVSTKGRSRPERTYEATGTTVYPEGPLVVLVDRGSASASEIVAGALQDRKRAKVVGDRTFGKGVFQEVKELGNGGALDITVGEYFTPSGRNLGGGGVKRGAGLTPDVKARDKRATPKRDEALDKAVQVVLARAGGR